MAARDEYDRVKRADRQAADAAAIEEVNSIRPDTCDDPPMIEVAVKCRDGRRTGGTEVGGDAVCHLLRLLRPTAGKWAARDKGEPMLVAHMLLSRSQQPDHTVEAQTRAGEAEVTQFLHGIVVQYGKQRGPLRAFGGEWMLA